MYRLAITHPEFYQGRGQHRHYFEGWYFKHVTSDLSTTLSVIPGVSYTPEDTHAFIQVIISPHHQTYYFRFPINSFTYCLDQMAFMIGPNLFSKRGITLDLRDEDVHLKGTILFGPFTPIKKHFWSPTIMGPLAFLPAMECNHGVISMHHSLDGQMQLNDRTIEFNQGVGYLEKDWGRSFPSSYVWMHSNHFQDPKGSFVASIARIPYLGLSFQGFFLNLQTSTREYRFATYTGARQRLIQKTAEKQIWLVKQGRYELQFTAILDPQNGARLAAPKNGAMTKGIKEGLTGYIDIVLKHKGKIIWQDSGQAAGIEFVDHLLD